MENNIVKKIDLNARVDYDTARCLMLIGMAQGVEEVKSLNGEKVTYTIIHKQGNPFYVTIYKTNTVRKLVSLNKGHDRDADAMCYAPTMNDALHWVEGMICND